MINWSDLLIYDESSKSCLRWKVDVNSKSARAGDPAGKIVKTKSGNLYWKITYKGRGYLAHRIVYELCTGEKLDPKTLIDHYDGNGLNNKFLNMRKADHKTNRRNSRRFNTIGENGLPFGMCWHSEGHSIRVRLPMIDGKRISKSFSLAKYCGLENAIQAAIEWREMMILELDFMSHGYTEQHLYGRY